MTDRILAKSGLVVIHQKLDLWLDFQGSRINSVMDNQAFPLIQTKIILPAQRPKMIIRAHLMSGAVDHPYNNLILVCAPAGYGKSTFLTELSHIFQNQGWAVAWYSIDLDDDRENLFGAYLFQSIIQTLGTDSILNQSGQLIRSSAAVDLTSLMPSLINAIAASGSKVMLVLDDYHFIRNPAINRAMAFLIEHIPDNLRLVIGTRSDPRFPLARYRARGRLIEYHSSDLRFNLEETGKFLREIMKLDLSPEIIHHLEERTEGWAAGLQLAALSMTRLKNTCVLFTGFPIGHRYLVNYLVEEVFDGLTEVQKNFLLSTAIFDRLSASLCEAVLGSESGNTAILQELEQNNLFIIPLDENGTWYRYHHLFRDFLLSRIKKDGRGNARDLHCRACEWLSENGYLREAANHAFNSGDWEFAASFVEKHSFEMIIQSEIAALAEWCARFPEEVILRHPLLAVHQCWGWVFSFRRSDRERIEARLKQAKQSAERSGNERIAKEVHENEIVIRQMISMTPDPAADPKNALFKVEKILKTYSVEDASQFSFLLNVGYIHMAMNEVGKAEEAFTKARGIALEEKLFFGVVESSFQLARLIHVRGNLKIVVEFCDAALAELKILLGESGIRLPGMGCLDIAAGCALFEMNQIAEAEERLRHGLDLVGWGMNPYYFFIANITLYRIYQSQDLSAESETCLSNLETIWPDISFLTKGLRILSKLGQNNNNRIYINHAQEWSEDFLAICGDIENMPGFGPFAACEIYYLAAVTWLRVQITLGNGNKAEHILDKYLNLAQSKGLRDREVELSLIKMSTQKFDQYGSVNFDRFTRVISDAIDEGYFQVFIQEEAVAGFLEQTAKLGIRREIILELLGEIAHRKGSSQKSDWTTGKTSAADQISPLSKREKEILILLERGESNQAISDSLVITIGTVKSHLNHILAKLDAENRTQAVARARELGLFD
ncbi:MAG: LuxR C-terminal-related transcriptional regulator [Anaerolineaceae bacterium]